MMENRSQAQEMGTPRRRDSHGPRLHRLFWSAGAVPPEDLHLYTRIARLVVVATALDALLVGALDVALQVLWPGGSWWRSLVLLAIFAAPAAVVGVLLARLVFADAARRARRRRATLQALRESEQRLRTVVSNAPLVLFAVDRDGTFAFSDGKGLAALGFQPGELVGRSAYDVYRDSPEIAENIRRALAGDAFTVVVPAAERRFETRYEPIYDAEHGIVGAIGVAIDITAKVHEQRRRELLLRCAHRFAALTDPADLPRALLEETLSLYEGSTATVFRWNEREGLLEGAASNMTALPDVAPVALGFGLPGRAAAERRPCVINDYQQAMQEESQAWRAGIRAGVAAPLLHEGKLLGAVAVGTRSPGVQYLAEDVEVLEVLATTAAATLSSLERARLQGVLLAARTVEHELNNQLALTVGYAELLAQDPALPAELREPALEALRGAQEAARTIERLRRITKLEETDIGSPDGRIVDLRQSAA